MDKRREESAFYDKSSEYKNMQFLNCYAGKKRSNSLKVWIVSKYQNWSSDISWAKHTLILTLINLALISYLKNAITC